MKKNHNGECNTRGSKQFFLQSRDQLLKNMTSTYEVFSKGALLGAICIGILVVLVTILVYMTGGTPTAVVHLMYVPIIMAVFVFGIKGGLLTAFTGGMLVGPLMQYVGVGGSITDSFSWIFRIAMFMFIALVIGLLTDYIKNANNMERKKAYEDILTGFPNLNKFKTDLNEILKNEEYETISSLLFKFDNMETINQYVNYDVGKKSFEKILLTAAEFFEDGRIYTVDEEKLMVLLPGCDAEAAYKLAKKFSRKMKQTIYVNELPIAVILKGGLVNIPKHCNNADELIVMLAKTLAQAGKTGYDIMMFDMKFVEESGRFYDTLISLYRAVENDKFTLVYQPKISLADNKVHGVEALLRWNEGNLGNVPTAYMIKIAEDAEFISQITKWVIKTVAIQLKKWESEGVDLSIAINLSSKDLKDSSMVEHIKECVEFYQIPANRLEIELTERSIIDDPENVFNILNELRSMGLKVSLDDYGTGHNSLVYLMKLLFKFDYIKIDKIFIDNIETENNRILIDGIIKASHGGGMQVVAEGVETKKQLEILEEIGCDIIQGYYYSRPVPPEGIKEFLDSAQL